MIDTGFIYIAFFKPYGVLTAFTDPEGRDTLKAYIPLPDVYPVGRLDLDSEGLLLLTNDGPLAHRLTDPAFHHPKTYLVQVEGEITDEALAALEKGLEIKGGYQTHPCQANRVAEPELPPRAKPISPHGPTSWIKMVLREGKKRQIRHMTAAVGFPTLRLVRVAIGMVNFEALQPGQWRMLTPAEVLQLKTMKSDRLPDARSKAGRKPGGSPGSARGSRYRNGGRRSPGP